MTAVPVLATLLLSLSLPGAPAVLGPDDPGIARRVESWPRTDPPAVEPMAAQPANLATPPQQPAAPPVPALPATAEPPPTVAVPVPAPGIESRRGPTLMLSYRQFGFVRVGAVEPGSSGAAPQTFHFLSLDLIPISWILRISLAPEFGWASGSDWFVGMSGAIGLQWPALVTPFAEFNIGGGYLRREQFGIGVPTALVHMGVDAGAAVRIARHFWAGASVGYLRPVNWFFSETAMTGVYANAFTFKLSIGF